MIKIYSFVKEFLFGHISISKYVCINLFFFLTLCNSKSQAQPKFDVVGSFNNSNFNKEITVHYQKTNSVEVHKKITCKRGEFYLKDTLENPTPINISFGPNSNSLSFFVDTGLITIKIKLDSFYLGKNKHYKLNLVKLSESNIEKIRLRFIEQLKSIYSLKTNQHSKADTLFNLMLKTATIYPKYSFVADVLLESDILSYKQAKELFDKFSPLQQSIAQKRGIERFLNRIKKLETGSKFIYFEQQDTASNIVKIENFKAKYLLINFWSSSCGPCIKEHPELIKIYEEYKQKGFEILGISLDYSKQAWINAIIKGSLPWINVSDLSGNYNKILEYYSIDYIPYNILINDKHEIIGKDYSLRDLTDTLKSLF